MYSQDYKAKAKASKQIISNYASLRNDNISISLSSALGNATALQSMSNVLQKQSLPSQPGNEVVQMFPDKDGREVSYTDYFWKKHITGEIRDGTCVTADSVESEISETHLQTNPSKGYWYPNLRLLSSSAPIWNYFDLKVNYYDDRDECSIYHLESYKDRVLSDVPPKPKAVPSTSFTIDDFPSIEEAFGKRKK